MEASEKKKIEQMAKDLLDKHKEKKSKGDLKDLGVDLKELKDPKPDTKQLDELINPIIKSLKKEILPFNGNSTPKKKHADLDLDMDIDS